jgi:hypothetical protein
MGTGDEKALYFQHNTKAHSSLEHKCAFVLSSVQKLTLLIDLNWFWVFDVKGERSLYLPQQSYAPVSTDECMSWRQTDSSVPLYKYPYRVSFLTAEVSQFWVIFVWYYRFIVGTRLLL